MSRRQRCPYCCSLNTAECVSATREGTNIQWFRICDDCDCSFSFEKDSPHYVPPDKRLRRAAAADNGEGT